MFTDLKSFERFNCSPVGTEDGTMHVRTMRASSLSNLRANFYWRHTDLQNPNFTFDSSMYWHVSTAGAVPSNPHDCGLNC